MISFFELSLSHESLNEDILSVFGSVSTLWETSFLKKENYSVEGNGRLRLDYGVKLKSDLLEKEIFLHMLSVQKSEKEMLRAYCKKVKGDKEGVEKQLKEDNERMRKIIEAYQSFTQLIPLKNKMSDSFAIRGDVIQYSSTFL